MFLFIHLTLLSPGIWINAGIYLFPCTGYTVKRKKKKVLDTIVSTCFYTNLSITIIAETILIMN